MKANSADIFSFAPAAILYNYYLYCVYTNKLLLAILPSSLNSFMF